MEAKQATLHHELIAQLLDSRIPKTKREHAAAREIESLRAALLQELVDAPEPEPVARVTGYYAGYLSIATVDGRVLPAGTALYTAPPAPETEPVGYLYTNVQSGESHVSDYDDDYRGPERALWCIEPVYRRAKGQS